VPEVIRGIAMATLVTVGCGHAATRSAAATPIMAPRPGGHATRPHKPPTIVEPPVSAPPSTVAGPSPTVAPPVAGTAPAATTTASERGKAVWYASGKRTANGERFDKRAMTAAHRTLPFGTWVRVTVDRTGRSVTVRINDRGPFGDKRRIIDLTQGAAQQLGIIDAGAAAVTLEILPGAP
jgi:rare lipoprotein A